MPPYQLELGSLRLRAADELPREVAEAWLRSPPAAGEVGVRRVESEVGPVAVKRDTSRALRRLAHAFGGRSLRAARAFELGLELRARGLPCPAPLAVLERREGLLDRPATLVLRWLEGADLHACFREGRPGSREDLWIAIARVVALLHRQGFRHRDLKAPNILVAGGGGGDVPGVSLLDLDGVSRTRTPAPLGLRRADLGRLAASARSEAALEAGVGEADVRQLNEAYLLAFEGRPGAPAEIDEWVAAARGHADRWVEHCRRLGRPLA